MFIEKDTQIPPLPKPFVRAWIYGRSVQKEQSFEKTLESRIAVWKEKGRTDGILHDKLLLEDKPPKLPNFPLGLRSKTP